MDPEDTQASLLPSEGAPDRGADEESKLGQGPVAWDKTGIELTGHTG